MELVYLPLRARAEALRMMIRYANLPVADHVVSLEEWPLLKPQMPKGGGAEYPGRPAGNRALPVLKFPDGTLLPESSHIAEYLASLAPDRLIPHDGAVDARELFVMSQSLPLFWPTALLVRFPEEVADKIMHLDHAGLTEARFGDDAATPVLPWLKQQPGWTTCIEQLKSLEKRLASGPFFGGVSPHYGDFGVWAQVNSMVVLCGEDVAFAGFGLVWREWYAFVAALDGVRDYLSGRPVAGFPGAGHPSSIIAKHAQPALRSRI